MMYKLHYKGKVGDRFYDEDWNFPHTGNYEHMHPLTCLVIATQCLKYAITTYGEYTWTLIKTP